MPNIVTENKLSLWIERGWNVLFTGKHGTGKCLGKGTPILMFDGTIKPVEQIVEGDKLMGPDSKPKTVLSTTAGREMLYEIVPTKGDSYVVNESHILSLKACSNCLGYKKNEIVNISVRDFIQETKTFQRRLMGWRTGVSLGKQEISLDPYFLGVWLGDGHSDGASITNGNKKITDWVRNYTEKNGLKFKKVADAGKAVTYRLSAEKTVGKPRKGKNPILTMLQELDLIQNKHIPYNYLVNTYAVRMQVLAGILDTDGGMSSNCFDITLKSERLIDDICFLARSLGFAAYKKKSKRSCIYKGKKITGIYWRTNISGDTSKIPVRVKHKKCQTRKQIKDVLKTYIEPMQVGVGDYYGFELDGDGLFLLGDFTVTHNTTIVRQAFERAGLKYRIYSAATMDPWVDFIGVPKEKIAENGKSYLDLVRPRDFEEDEVEAIFFDELNRSHKKIRNAVLELIQFKSINDRKFKNLKVVWAACNPSDDADQEYDVESLDPAQQDRFHIQVELPYKPDRKYFVDKFGTEVASIATNWWNALTDPAKNLVSPRRLDYALEIWEGGGQLEDVLPVISNVAKLRGALRTTPIMAKLQKFFDDQKNGTRDRTIIDEEVRVFLADENNYQSVEKEITRRLPMVAYFVPLLPQEKIAALLNSSSTVSNYFLRKFTDHPKIMKVMQEIVDSNTNTAIAKEFRRAMQMAKASKLNDLKSTVEVNPTRAASYSAGRSRQGNGFDSIVSTLSHGALDDTYSRLSAYKRLEDLMPTEMNVATASDTLKLINTIIRRSHNGKLSRWTNLMGIINNCMENLHKQNWDFELLKSAAYKHLMEWVSSSIEQDFYFDIYI